MHCDALAIHVAHRYREMVVGRAGRMVLASQGKSRTASSHARRTTGSTGDATHGNAEQTFSRLETLSQKDRVACTLRMVDGAAWSRAYT
jgi:hypothetical protein